MILYHEGDTIAAESTPAGRGGISLVRLSGPAACKIASTLFDRSLPIAGRHSFGKLIAPDSSRTIDEAVVSVFEAGKSYTGEEVVEFAVHGSPLVVADLLECLYKLGARAAEAGEFTLRAYLNGRIDLIQAEAVADLIAAGSRQSADLALRQLAGGLSRPLVEIENLVEQLLIWSELELDFVEEDVELANVEQKIETAELAAQKLKCLTDGYQTARRVREGVTVAITGAPNVGKSSLFNALLGVPRAIVHPSPGTTRDVVQSKCYIKDIAFELFDTAGLRRAVNEVEDEGVKRAVQTAQNADIILTVLAVDNYNANAMLLDTNTPVIEVMNKIDLRPDINIDNKIAVSAMTGFGLEELKENMYKTIIDEHRLNAVSLNRERHFFAAQRALSALQEGCRALQEAISGDILAEYWRETLAAVGEITGKNRCKNLLNEIFSKFCIGK